MLARLCIENIAVIEWAELTFEPGLNVLTGETGAGKSIVIDALGAVLGERTSRDLVRAGADEARVTAVFERLSRATVQALTALGCPPDEEGVILLSRNIGTDGRTVCRIGGRPVTAAMLRDVGRVLVNTHGQHENQALLAVERHLDYLDKLGGLIPLRETYADTYHRYCAIRRSLSRLQTDEDEKQRRTELLQFQIAEIEDANLTAGEEDALSERRQFFRHSEKIAALIQKAVVSLHGDGTDEAVSAPERVSASADSLSAAATLYPSVEALSERLRALSAELQECDADLRAFQEDLEFNESERDAVEDRLAVIRRLTGKYGATTADVLAFAERCRTELNEIEHADEQKAALEAELSAAETVMVDAAHRLTAARRAAADDFGRRVAQELSYLDMPQVALEVSVTPAPLTVTGGDKVEYLIAANAGEPAKSIAKVASGGELSRVMLAIKTVMADVDDIDTL
ncbi:MAG: AAA family ATPase, partial [Clostridia bacterium]|nr:AAA family ATPase [Clostridia bacterium]